MSGLLRAEARIDLAALRANVAALRSRAGSAELMAVVKADAYGHGLVPCARAAVQGGATWLGVALIEEAIALRAAGVPARILAWLYAPSEPLLAEAVAADVDVAAYAPWAVTELAAAARATGRTARVHLKADTGLSRGGAAGDGWPELVQAALVAQAEGAVRIVGLYSHLVSGDVPNAGITARQAARFAEAVAYAEQAGVRPEVRHLLNSGGLMTTPAAAYDLVRCGIATYGLMPGPDLGSAANAGLTPVMTLAARLALVKRVAAGEGFSYGSEYVTKTDTHAGLIPVGYGDGLPRHGSNVGPVYAAGRRRTIAGRVCMDQVIVDLGDDAAAAGDEVLFFGPGSSGEPTATDWADATGTINYEIVTQIGPRVPRVYLHEREG